MELVVQWLRAFTITLVIELAVAVPLLGSVAGWQRRVSAVTLAQLASHPAVWLVFPLLGLSRTGYLLVAESWAVLLEFALYRTVFANLSGSKALAVAALANAASFAVGLVLRAAHVF